jgi:hypothetical protein
MAECQAIFEQTTKSFLGASYSYGSSGGASGRSSFDCSGLVLSVVNKLVDQAGMPRTSQDMYRSISQSVKLSEAQRGDLLFFNTGGGISHVGIYWGKDDKGQALMFHASSSKGVELRPLQSSKYWMSRLVGVKRLNLLTNALILPTIPQIPDLSNFGKSSKSNNSKSNNTSNNKLNSSNKKDKVNNKDSATQQEKADAAQASKEGNKIEKKNNLSFKPMKKHYSEYTTSSLDEIPEPVNSPDNSKDSKHHKVSTNFAVYEVYEDEQPRKTSVVYQPTSSAYKGVYDTIAYDDNDQYSMDSDQQQEVSMKSNSHKSQAYRGQAVEYVYEYY